MVALWLYQRFELLLITARNDFFLDRVLTALSYLAAVRTRIASDW